MEFTFGNAIDLAEINKVEAELGVKFPNDFIDVVKVHDGAYVLPGCYYMENGVVESINNFHNVSDIPSECDIDTTQGLVPIARDAGGNQICFDYRNSLIPEVVFWDHETENVTRIASDFTAFLSKLEDIDEK